jgi:hypothetical protein
MLTRIKIIHVDRIWFLFESVPPIVRGNAAKTLVPQSR